jgi:hypothetical protein
MRWKIYGNQILEERERMIKEGEAETRGIEF